MRSKSVIFKSAFTKYDIRNSPRHIFHSLHRQKEEQEQLRLMREQHENDFANRTFKDILTPKAPFLSPIGSPKKDEDSVRYELSPLTRGINSKINDDKSKIHLLTLMQGDRSGTPGPKSVVFADFESHVQKRGTRLEKLAAVNDRVLRKSMAGAKL